MSASDGEKDDALPLSSSRASDDVNDDVVRFTFESETNRKYRRFNAVGTELTVRLIPPVKPA